MEQEFFRNLPEMPAPVKVKPAGAARMREPARDQIEWLLMNWDGLIGADHPARVLWDYVQKIDLSALEGAIKAREHTPGQAPPSPQLMMALWLYAASQRVGSARALAQLCTQHDAYRWLCGGVSMNYHTLSDFRTVHGELLERLLIEHVASLSAAKVINLDEVMQDGLRVRAAAGAGSFHREESTQAHLDKATSLIERLKQEQEGDFEASNRRIKAARERAARERKERLEAALAKHKELVAERERRAKTSKAEVAKQKEPRASTTDAEARNRCRMGAFGLPTIARSAPLLVGRWSLRSGWTQPAPTAGKYGR